MAKVTKAAVSIALSKGRIHAERNGSMNPDRPENAAYLTSSKRQRRQGKRGAGGKKGATHKQSPPPSKRGRRKRSSRGADRAKGGEPLRIEGESFHEADLRKTIADADLKEQKLAKDRGELLTRGDVKLVFARLYQVHSSQLKTLAEKLGPDVAAAFSLTDPAATLKVQQIMDEEVRRALGQIKKEMNDYLDAIGDGTVDDPN